jgi:hypothetical protein
MVQSLGEALAGGPMQTSCLVFLVVIDIVCGLIIPIYETLYHLRNYRVARIYSSKLTHWTTYWIFFGVLHLI